MLSGIAAARLPHVLAAVRCRADLSECRAAVPRGNSGFLAACAAVSPPPLSIVCGAVPFGVFPSEYPEFMLSCTAGPELRAIESARTFRRSPLLRVCGFRHIRITAHRDADRRPGCKKGLGPLISIRKRMPEMRGGGSLSSMRRGAWPPAVWNGDCRCREVLTAGIPIYIALHFARLFPPPRTPFANPPLSRIPSSAKGAVPLPGKAGASEIRSQRNHRGAIQ